MRTTALVLGALAAAVVAVVVCGARALEYPAELVAEGPAGALLFDSFDAAWDRWVTSADPRYNGRATIDAPPADKSAFGEEDKMLTLPESHRFYGLSAPLTQPFVFSEGKPLVLQYEARFTSGIDCGGAYVKLLQDSYVKEHALSELDNTSPYVIMFGPDRCGDSNRVHFIVRVRSPVTNTYEEKHMRHAPEALKDDASHLYTLVVRPDNTFALSIDGEDKRHGSLLTDFDPPFNPPAEIDDPTDSKPADWVDNEQMPDPEAQKPDDWDESQPPEIPDPDAVMPENWLEDEPEFVQDPSASAPADWNEEEDGEWEAPLVRNPKCEAVGCGKWVAPLMRNPKFRGKWSAPLIPNPAYKGPWKARQIANPVYYHEENPFAKLDSIGALAFELWTTNRNFMFNNLLVGTDEAGAAAFAAATFTPRFNEEKRMRESAFVWDALYRLYTTPVALVVQFNTYFRERPFVMSAILLVLAAVLMLILICIYKLLRRCCCRSAGNKGGNKAAAAPTAAAAAATNAVTDTASTTSDAGTSTDASSGAPADAAPAAEAPVADIDLASSPTSAPAAPNTSVRQRSKRAGQ